MPAKVLPVAVEVKVTIPEFAVNVPLLVQLPPTEIGKPAASTVPAVIVRSPFCCVVIPPVVNEKVLLALLNITLLYVVLATFTPVVFVGAYSMVLVEGVKVPEITNGVPLPLNHKVLEPFILRV